MLSTLEPSVELTGGSWYSDNVLDTEFIEQMATQILKFISRKPQCAIDDVHYWISERGLTSQPLSLQVLLSIPIAFVMIRM